MVFVFLTDAFMPSLPPMFSVSDCRQNTRYHIKLAYKRHTLACVVMECDEMATILAVRIIIKCDKT